MQGLHILNQFAPLLIKFVSNACIFLWTYDVSGIQSLLQLFENMALGDFVRVHFKAEWTKIYLLQTFLYHTQGCHLLSNKQHTLALEQGIGYKIRNGLRLTRSRRAV